MAAIATTKVWIQAAPERVFPLIEDLGAHGTWSNQKAALSIKPAGDGTYKADAIFLKKPVQAAVKVVRDQAPRAFAFETTHTEGTYLHEFELTPERGGTTVTRRATFPDKGALGNAFLRAVIVPLAYGPDAKKSLKKLKAIAER